MRVHERACSAIRKPKEKYIHAHVAHTNVVMVGPERMGEGELLCHIYCSAMYGADDDDGRTYSIGEVAHS